MAFKSEKNFDENFEILRKIMVDRYKDDAEMLEFLDALKHDHQKAMYLYKNEIEDLGIEISELENRNLDDWQASQMQELITADCGIGTLLYHCDNLRLQQNVEEFIANLNPLFFTDTIKEYDATH